jgi:hypothetical protein
MLRGCKHRAKLLNLPFDLSLSDIVVPKRCPVLGIPLIVNTGGLKRGPNTPSVDRIKPERGYVKDNIVVISWRANRIKSDATVAELQKLAKFYSTVTKRKK